MLEMAPHATAVLGPAAGAPLGRSGFRGASTFGSNSITQSPFVGRHVPV